MSLRAPFTYVFPVQSAGKCLGGCRLARTIDFFVTGVVVLLLFVHVANAVVSGSGSCMPGHDGTG